VSCVGCYIIYCWVLYWDRGDDTH